MKFIKLNCNNCNAPLDIDIEKLQAYCPYCGQKLLFDLDQMERVLAEKEQTKRAKEKTKRAEEVTKQVEEATKREHIKYDYKDKKDRRKNETRRIMFIVAAILLILDFGVLLYLSYSTKRDHQLNDDVKVSASSEDLIKESVEDAIRILENCGFKNITVTNKGDLVVGLLSKEGEIESISINGKKEFSSSSWFPRDSVVIISYHGFKEK